MNEYVNPYFTNLLPKQQAQTASQIVAGGAAGAAGHNPQDFSFDWGQVAASGAQGFAAGGPVGAAVGTLVGGAKQIAGIYRNAKNLDTSVDGVTNDMYGRPVYQGGNISQAFNTVSALEKGEKSLKPLSGSLGPGATALLQHRRRQLMRNISQAQQQYNTADRSHRDQMIQREQYLERLYR